MWSDCYKVLILCMLYFIALELFTKLSCRQHPTCGLGSRQSLSGYCDEYLQAAPNVRPWLEPVLVLLL